MSQCLRKKKDDGYDKEKLMSCVVVAPNSPYKDHLEYVSNEMKRLGPPRLRAIWLRRLGVWFAAEGSHRIAVAHRDGIVPVLIDITGHGATVQRNGMDTTMSADELKEWLVSDRNAPRYIFDTVVIEREGDKVDGEE